MRHRACHTSCGEPYASVRGTNRTQENCAVRHAQILQRADVPGTNLELILATVDIAPHAKAGRHTHPGMTMSVIEEGDFWLHVDGESAQVLHAGDSTSNPNRAIHDEGSLDKPVKLTAVYVTEKGKPLASPAP